MSKKIKLIWDFRGPKATKIAEHHEIHLKEFSVAEKIVVTATGFQTISDMYALAYMVINEEQMIPIRDALKPHRGEIYEE